MSPQDAMMHLKNMHNGAADPYKDGPFPKGKNSKIGIWLFLIKYNIISYLKTNCSLEWRHGAVYAEKKIYFGR